MMAKRSLLCGALLLMLGGLLTAATHFHWWRGGTVRIPVVEREQPSAAAEYRKIAARYRGPDSATDISGTIRIYDAENKNTLKETRTFHCVRSGRQYYMQLSYLQTFCDGLLLLQLDTVHRTIRVSRAPADSNPVTGRGNGPLDVLFSDTSAFRITGTVSDGDGEERVMRLHSDVNPEVRSYSLYYDTLAYRLHKAEIEWWKVTPVNGEPVSDKIWRAKVDYHYRSAEKMDMEERIRSIVSIVKGQVKTAPFYRDYQLYGN